MKTVLIETPLSAPVEVVWNVLTDLPRYGEWNPGLSIRAVRRTGTTDHTATP